MLASSDSFSISPTGKLNWNRDSPKEAANDFFTKWPLLFTVDLVVGAFDLLFSVSEMNWIVLLPVPKIFQCHIFYLSSSWCQLSSTDDNYPHEVFSPHLAFFCDSCPMSFASVAVS